MFEPLQEPKIDNSASRFSFITAYALSLFGLFAGGVYYVWLNYGHQSSASDAQMLVVFGAVFWLPVSLVILAPAIFLYRLIAKEPRLNRKCLLSIAAGLLPLAMIVFGVINQGTDWDELLLFIIPFAPTVLALIGLVTATQGAR